MSSCCTPSSGLLRIQSSMDQRCDYKLHTRMKGTEVPNPRRSSACDCTCVLTRIDHCLVNNGIMTFALDMAHLSILIHS